jgi:hypothetical protein
MLPSPVSSAPTSQSIGGYKRTMSPSLTNLRTPAVGIQQRSRTPLDTTSLSTLTISTSQSLTSQPQTFGIAPQQPTAVQTSMSPEPIQPQIPAIATTVTATILSETSKPIAASSSQISIESKAPPATTSAPLAFSLLGPWVASDSSAFNSRSTSSPSIPTSSVKDEAVTKSEAIIIQSTFSSTTTASISEPRFVVYCTESPRKVQLGSYYTMGGGQREKIFKFFLEMTPLGVKACRESEFDIFKVKNASLVQGKPVY